jgi:hypothetical protein
MAKDNIDKILDYYNKKRLSILQEVNSKTNITAEQLIDFGEEMAILEYKMTALEIAKQD